MPPDGLPGGDPLLEELAGIEHERWSHWQRYMHDQCEPNPDGSLTIPQKLVARWTRQASTPYEALTEAEKESDREQVRRYLPTVLAWFEGGEGGRRTADSGADERRQDG